MYWECPAAEKHAAQLFLHGVVDGDYIGKDPDILQRELLRPRLLNGACTRGIREISIARRTALGRVIDELELDTNGKPARKQKVGL